MCFRYDEKYHFGHKCKTKEQGELRIFVARENNEEVEIIEEYDFEKKKEMNSLKIEEEVKPTVELFINSIVGLYSNLGTMKVRGRIKGEEVIVLIDYGTIHNFISKKMVSTLQLPMKETCNYRIILGSRTAIKRKGVCEVVELLLNEWKVVESFLTLKLGGVDIILGMQGLYSLGVI